MPYTQATNRPLGGMLLAFAASGPLSDRRRIRLGNVTTGGPLEAHRCPLVARQWLPSADRWRCHRRTTSGPLVACVSGSHY